MAFFLYAFNIAVFVAKSPITRVVFSAVTGKPYTTAAVLEEFSKTQTYAYLKFRGSQAVSGVVETAKFDPKNPLHYQPANQTTYNPFSVRMKAFKAASYAARDALNDARAGKQYVPPVAPSRMTPQRSSKPITDPKRMLEH